MNNELIEKIKAAKTAEEVIEIARKALSLDDTSKVAGGTGRVELTEAQAERVVGGGHYVTLLNGGFNIDMADEIFVINVGSYIGSSTRSEIEYAKATGKPIHYLEESGGTKK